MKRLMVRKFKGKVLIDLREFWKVRLCECVNV
jgi:hypothetical protein